MKKYLFIISDFYGGGAQRVLIKTAYELHERGHKVSIITLRDRIEQEVPDCLDIIRLQVITRFTKLFSNSIIEKIQALRINTYLKTLSPDVVISCSCDKITRHLKYDNLYFWIHSDISAEEKFEKKKKLAQKFYNGRKIITVSHGIENNLLNKAALEPLESHVIYNPFSQDELLQKSIGETVIEYDDYFISVGTIEKRKDHETLLRAYAKSGLKTALVILGKGKKPEEEHLNQLIKELNLENRVHFIGYKLNPYPYIKKAKCLVLSSTMEGLPTVLIEALILKTPVISTDCPSGPKEILTGELSDFLVPMKNEDSLADSLIKMDRAPLKVTQVMYERFLKEKTLPLFESL